MNCAEITDAFPGLCARPRAVSLVGGDVYTVTTWGEASNVIDCMSGGEMKILVRNINTPLEEKSEWIEAGSWFESIANLPEAIRVYNASNPNLKRVLLTAPNPTLISLAFAFGASRDAFLQHRDTGQILSVDELKVGDLLQIAYSWKNPSTLNGSPQPLKRRLVIGEFVTSALVDGILQLTLTCNGLRIPTAVHPHYLAKGEITFHKMQAGTPQGEFSQEIPNRSGANADRWKFYFSQVDPQYAFFGDGDFMKTLGSLEFHETELCDLLLGVSEPIPMTLATRMDQLTNDKEVHFVNTYDEIAHFPKQNTLAWESLKALPGTVFIGNRATELLSKKTALASKLQISLWDTGRSYMQDQALQAFVASSAYFDPIEDFETSIGWQAPAGVQVWGWR